MSGASSEFGRDHGLIHEVVITGRKSGWGINQWSKLAHDAKLMEQICEVIDGRASVVENPDPNIELLKEEHEAELVEDTIKIMKELWPSSKELHAFTDNTKLDEVASTIERMVRGDYLSVLNAIILIERGELRDFHSIVGKFATLFRKRLLEYEFLRQVMEHAHKADEIMDEINRELMTLSEDEVTAELVKHYGSEENLQEVLSEILGKTRNT